MHTGNGFVGAKESVPWFTVCVLFGVDLRGVYRGDSLAGRGLKLIVDKEAGGLLVAVPVRSDVINKKIHVV